MLLKCFFGGWQHVKCGAELPSCLSKSCIIETLFTRFENLEKCYFPNSPQTVPHPESTWAVTLETMSKCFAIASLISAHFHLSSNHYHITLHELIDFVGMNHQIEDISVISYHTCTIFT